MRWHTTDYTERSRRSPGARAVNRGFWLSGVPRLIVLCRLFGHRPTVDGVDYGGPSRSADATRARWVCCDRCGIRPEPQGKLDAERYEIDDRYDGPQETATPTSRDEPLTLTCAPHPPGPWPNAPTGTLGGQLVLGRAYGGIGVEVKVGNAGSEQVLAASVRLHHLATLHLHSERHGTWLQRRLNRHGFDSRVIAVGIDHGKLHWKLWTKRDASATASPRWRTGGVCVDPRDLFAGPVCGQLNDIGQPVQTVVRMPHGDDHDVTLQLQERVYGRRRGRTHRAWTVVWTCHMGSPPGIPVQPGIRGAVRGAQADVSGDSVESGQWPMVAAADIARRLTEARISNDYRPVEPQPV